MYIYLNPHVLYIEIKNHGLVLKIQLKELKTLDYELLRPTGVREEIKSLLRAPNYRTLKTSRRDPTIGDSVGIKTDNKSTTVRKSVDTRSH